MLRFYSLISRGKGELTLSLAVWFIVSNRRTRNGFAVRRDAPTIACRLMALELTKVSNLFTELSFFSSSSLNSISGLAYLDFCEPPVLIAFGNERLASRRRLFAQSASTGSCLVSFVQPPGCSLSQASL